MSGNTPDLVWEFLGALAVAVLAAVTTGTVIMWLGLRNLSRQQERELDLAGMEWEVIAEARQITIDAAAGRED